MNKDNLSSKDGSKPKILIESRVPLERRDTLKRVVFNDGALAALKLTTERYLQSGYNDLLVFFVNPGQDGSERIVDRVAVLENETPGMAFKKDIGNEVEQLRSREPDLTNMVPLGIGSVAGYLTDVRNALQLGYRFYASCGDELYEDGQSPKVDDAGYWTVWAQDGEDIAEIESVVETSRNQ